MHLNNMIVYCIVMLFEIFDLAIMWTVLGKMENVAYGNQIQRTVSSYRCKQKLEKYHSFIQNH